MPLGLSDTITLEVIKRIVSPIQSTKTKFLKCHAKSMFVFFFNRNYLKKKKLKNFFPLYKTVIAYL